jgi:cell wall-associated NlpC family hydrolase
MRLKPHDCLLYAPKGIFGQIIRLKTWHAVAHCEIYAGMGHSFASRDGLGVGIYPLRTEQLIYILRPHLPRSHRRLNWHRAQQYYAQSLGTPYGWLELLNFLGITERGKGLFCSEFVTYYYRAAGWNIFPEDDPAQVAPFEFLNLVGAGFELIAEGPHCQLATP